MLYSPEEQVTVRMSQGLVRYLREEGILQYLAWKLSGFWFAEILSVPTRDTYKQTEKIAGRCSFQGWGNYNISTDQSLGRVLYCA